MSSEPSDIEYALWVADRVRRMFQAFIDVDVRDERFEQFLAKALLDEGITEPRSAPYAKLYEAARKALENFVASKKAG